MKFTQNNHPTRLFGPTRLIGTWEYLNLVETKERLGYCKRFLKMKGAQQLNVFFFRDKQGNTNTRWPSIQWNNHKYTSGTQLGENLSTVAQTMDNIVHL